MSKIFNPCGRPSGNNWYSKLPEPPITLIEIVPVWSQSIGVTIAKVAAVIVGDGSIVRLFVAMQLFASLT